jgi:acetyltransferase-like isoleucine patch superfamily enzyme
MPVERGNVKIHPTADVSAEAEIGGGTVIWHQAHVREGVRIGRNCILGKGAYVDVGVTLGDNCKLQNGVCVYRPAIIENGVFLGPGAIVTNDKKPRAVNPEMRLKRDDDWEANPALIRDGAAVGAGAILLPGVTIGRWAMIGAGAVVTHDVPAQGLALGNPARLTGYVCICGERLAEVAAGEFSCPDCGRSLTVHGDL